MFLPDYWHPGNTPYHVHANSILWKVFDVPLVDIFEQESGQIIINRRRHLRALNVLMYYGFKMLRVHETMKIVWVTRTSFGSRGSRWTAPSACDMIDRPPGSAGLLVEDTNFCGVTMVQHDIHNEVIFLHRNWEKLTDSNMHRVWKHIQQFEYVPNYQSDVEGLGLRGYWGASQNWRPSYAVTPIDEFVFGEFELELIRFAKEAQAIQNTST